MANSTAIEGATLSSPEVEMLINDGMPTGGKPMEHHFMVIDNYNAMLYALERAREKKTVTAELLKKINSLNMKNTGSEIRTILGITDMTKGDFRMMAAKSKRLGYYENYLQIPGLVAELCNNINGFVPLDELSILQLAYESHCSLVLIHPWEDGNKRTSRLLTNYIEAVYDLPLTKVYKDDADLYLETLKVAKDTGNKEPFISFMIYQRIKTLQEEINLFKQMASI